MKTKLFLIAAILVLASMFTLMSCNKDDTADDLPNDEISSVTTVNEYAVEGAKLSTTESREELATKYKELQTLYNLAVDTVAKTEGETKQAVKDLGAEYIDLLKNKIANADYAQYEDFVKDATKQIEDLTSRLVQLVPSIAG